MAQDRRSTRALAALLPAGAFGLSVSLASADAAATASPDAGAQPKKPGEVAERLQSIRLSVSDALQQYAKDGEPFVAVDPEKQLAWWGNGWHNGGWGWQTAVGTMAGGPHPRAVQRGRRVGEQVELGLLLPKRLHDPHAGDRLLHHAGDGALIALVHPAGGNERVRKRLESHANSGTHTPTTTASSGDRNNMITNELASRARLPIDIASCWRNTWINVMSEVARDMMSPARSWSRRRRVEVLHVVVHGDLQVALHVDGGPPAEAAAAVVGDEADHADGDQQGDPRGERTLIGEHRVVEDHALHQRAKGEEHLRHHGQAITASMRPR